MFLFWRNSLKHFLNWFDAKRATTRLFYLKLVLFFIVLNLACYWWALLTTYPQHVVGFKGEEYVLMGFPVALLGAAFDSASLFVTIWIIKRALRSASNTRYIAYLSADLGIAVLATFWVLFAFVASGWIVGIILERPETFTSRTDLYESRVWRALSDPFGDENIRNIYFGIIMGASALLPTLGHLYMAGISALKFGLKRIGLL